VTGALVMPLEALHDGAWLFALIGVSREVAPRTLRWAAQVAPLVLLAFNVLVQFGWLPLAQQTAQHVQSAGGIGVALLVLVLIEHIYRNASSAGRHAFKFLALGLGGAYAYDLFLYSQATLLGTISADFWSARGVVNAALAPLIAVAARRNPAWSLDLFVSRQVVVVSTAVISVGVYLLLMAAGGYYVQRIGGTWGDLANMVYVAGALIVLATVILSGAARRRLRVFVHKHFYRNKFDYRVEWLRFVSTLSTPGDQDILRTCVEAMAQVFQSPGGVLFARDAREPVYTAIASWPLALRDSQQTRDIPADDEMVRFLGGKQWVIDLQEYRAAPELYQNTAIPEWVRTMRGVRFVSPLLHGSALEGFVLLHEPPPPFELTYEDRDLLKTMGRHVALVLARNASERRLTESRQFEAYHRLTAFMMHDLKNAIAQLDLVVANAAKHRHNPRFIDDAFETVANAASRMTGLMGQLRRSDKPELPVALNLGELLSEAAVRCADRQPVPRFDSRPATPPCVRAERVRLLNVIEHVIRNAQDASAPDTQLDLELSLQQGAAVVEVRDQGSGMTPEFVRDRLFRPFDSTKGAKGMGIGAYQVLEYVRSLGGDVEVSSRPGAGTSFRIKLPACPAQDG